MVVRQAPVARQVSHDARARRVEVADVVDITPRLRRVVLTGDVADLPDGGPTDHAKLFFPVGDDPEPVVPEVGDRGLVAPPPGQERPYREYTLAAVDPSVGTVTVEFVRHGAGLAGRWAEDPRGALWVYGPRSSLVVAPRDWYLLGGDETALPALHRWLDALPAGAAATVLVEVADAAEERDLAAAAPSSVSVDVRWLHRDGAAPGTTTLLSDAVAALTPPAGEGFCWMGAEASALRPVRRALRDVLPAEAVDLDGYWRRGVAGIGLG